MTCKQGHTERYANGNCKQCTRDARKRYREAHPERVAAQRAKWEATENGRQYLRNGARKQRGMTNLPAVDAPVGTLCEICSKPIPYAPQADHCHTSGAFRGWLCRPCNTGLAYVEKPGFVELAREYLGRK